MKHLCIKMTRGKSLKGKWQSGGNGPSGVERDASEGLGTGVHSIPLASSLTVHKVERENTGYIFFFS